MPTDSEELHSPRACDSRVFAQSLESHVEVLRILKRESVTFLTFLEFRKCGSVVLRSHFDVSGITETWKRGLRKSDHSRSPKIRGRVASRKISPVGRRGRDGGILSVARRSRRVKVCGAKDSRRAPAGNGSAIRGRKHSQIRIHRPDPGYGSRERRNQAESGGWRAASFLS